jgi:hypothetical protein
MAATAGSNISLTLGEWLEGDTPKSRNAGGGAQIESYTLAAGSPSPLQTLFVWHGFQYVLLTASGNTSFDGSLGAITGLEIYTGVESRAAARNPMQSRFCPEDQIDELGAGLLADLEASECGIGTRLPQGPDWPRDCGDKVTDSGSRCPESWREAAGRAVRRTGDRY